MNFNYNIIIYSNKSHLIINKPKGLSSKTEASTFGKYNLKNKTKNQDTSIINLNDYERIRKNATLTSNIEKINQNKIEEEQSQLQSVGNKNLKERIKNYDKINNNSNKLSDIERENLQINSSLKQKAKKIKDENTDEAKDLNKLIMYAKVASIRDKQLQESNMLKNEFKKYNNKLDLMMEIERLKELQLQEEREKLRKEQQYAGSLVIIDQIKDKEMERIKINELKEKDKQIMLKQVAELENEEKRNNDLKKKQAARLAKEVEESNLRATEIKEKKKIEEKELELKIHEYNLNRIKKEEEEATEKKRILEEKEKELQKMRDRQEKAKDKQSELDALRAKRAYEDAERQAREKARKEIMLKVIIFIIN